MALAYNCTKNEAAGYSLFYQLFGSSSRLLIDLIFNIKQAKEEADYFEFIKQWRSAMQEAFLLATENAKLLVGERVLVWNMSERRGQGKLRSFCEKIIYRVTKQHGNSPVYEVVPESGNGRTRVLHRNILLPCDYLPVTETKLTMVDPSQPNTTKESNIKEVSDEEIRYIFEREC